MKGSRFSQKGQSLVEVIVAVGIVVLLITGLVAGTTTSLRGNRFSSTKGPATKYAQEALEQARRLRDTSWSSFLSKSAGAGIWCLDASGTWTDASGTITNCNNDIDSTYTRYATFVWDGTRMKVTATVTWLDGDTPHTSELVTYFTQWR